LRVARECATQCLAHREGTEHVILPVISILSLLVARLENALWSQGKHLKAVRIALATDLLPRNRVKRLSLQHCSERLSHLSYLWPKYKNDLLFCSLFEKRKRSSYKASKTGYFLQGQHTLFELIIL